MMEIPQGFEGDDSILSGPGIGPYPKYAVKDPGYDMDGPQATSTVDQKASRMDKMQAYLKNLDTDELERKLLEEARKTRLPVTKTMVTDRELSLDPELSAISLINIDGMTGLSGSMIMDINSKASFGGTLQGVIQSHLSKETVGNGGPIEKASLQDTEDVSYYDLSEGELEEEAAIETHPRPPYNFHISPKPGLIPDLMNVSEKMRDHEGLDPSFELSNTQPRVWSCNTTVATQPEDASLEGLPSCLLSATSADPLMQAQTNNSLMQATHDESNIHGQYQHSFAKIPFAEAEMSARSTNFGEESKLLSDTVNSLGSFGTLPGEFQNDDFCSVAADKNQFPEWLGFDQEELVAMTEEEGFDKIDLDFFEEEEAKCMEENQFNNPEVESAESHLDFTTYSIREITVRPSWISSPERELVGPNHRMPVEDYLQRRSAALGSLGDDKGPRPSFGFENPVESPERPLQPLVHMSMMSNMSCFQDQDSEMDHEDVFQDGSYMAPGAPSSQMPTPGLPQSSELSKSSANSSNDTMHDSSTSDRDSHGSTNEKSNTLTATPTIDEMRTRMDNNLSQADYKDASVRPEEGNSQNLSGPYLPMRGYPDQSKNDHTNVELDNAKRRKITDDLERTLNEISKPLTPRKMQCLIQAAFKSSDPRSFVQKILQFNKEKAGHETLNSSDLEESMTVLQFRRENEEHRLRKKNEAQLEKEKQKENLIPKDIILNNESQQKTHLSSFRDSTGDFDASTPFIPRSRSASGSSTSTPANINDSDNSIKMGCRPLGNSHLNSNLGNSNLGKSPNVQRPRPKMGLVSSLMMGSNTSGQNSFNKPHENPVMGTTQNINSSSNLSVATSQNTKSWNEQRSNSVPLGLQATGVAKSVNAHEFSSANCLKSGVNKKSNMAEIQSIPNFPSEVIFPNVCLLGMMSQETLLFQNPVQRWVKLSLNILKETVSGIPSSRSCLIFKTSYIVGPGEQCSINIGVCSTSLGELEAILELRVLDLARETHSPLFSRRIFVQAVIQEPNVELVTKDGNMLYFGVVAEGCTISQEVTIINRSPLSVPVILNLQQDSSSMPQPIFTWGPASSAEDLTLISPVHLSLELPPAGETGPKPINATVLLKAPCLNTREVGETGLAARKCQLQVQLDAPKEPTLLVTTMAVEAHIGAVKLSYKKKEPLVLETNSPNETSSTVIPLQNSSSFSLQVTLLSSEYQDLFKVYPTSLSLQPHSQGSCTLTFIPNGNIGHMESVLLMRVEPDGMAFEISIIGISNPISSINSPRSLSPAPSSGIYSHSASMMSSVSSGSSRAPSPPHSYVNQTCLPPNSSHAYGNINFHKPLSHTASQPVSLIAPPSQPSFAIPSTTVTPATPTVAPSKEHLPKHFAVERSVSAPVAQKAFLDSTKSVLVFGTVQPGDSDSRKVVLRNNSMVDELRLLLTIRESKAFNIANCDTDDDKFECVLKPSDSIAIIIEFNPISVDSFKGMLIIKPQKMQTASKFQIPLQGYGGKGCIKVPDSTNGEPLLIRDLAAKGSSVFHMALSNFGERAVFVKVLVHEDEDCVKAICPEEITVQPSNLVIAPGNSRDVVIVVQGQPRIMSNLPGNIGTLKIISGDEVLRKRFCALKDKEVKTRYISDVSLLSCDWNVDFIGEKDSAIESDNLPQQKKEDAAIFYNNCSSQQIPLNGEVMANDQSSLSFACLEAVDTMTSMVDFTTLQERFDNTKDGFSPPVTEKNNADLNPKTTVNQTWNVFPQAITMIVSDDSPQNLHVVNFSPHEQIFEVVSNVKWLKVIPREAMLPSCGTVMLSVSLVPSLVPHFNSSQLSHTIEVMCENESRSVTIKVHQAIAGGSTSSVTTNATEGKSKQSIGNPDTLKQIVRDTSVTSKLSHVAKVKEVSQVSESSSAVGAPQRSMEVAHSSGVVAQRGIEVPQSLVFPPIAVGNETLLKITIKNLDSVPKTMKASVSNAPFAIRHTKFKVKPGFYIGLPVVFKPTQKGIFTGQVQLFSHEDNKTHVVQLSGKAL